MRDSALVWKMETSEGRKCYVPRSRVTKHCVLNSWIGTLEFAGNRSTSQFSYRMMDDSLAQRCCSFVRNKIRNEESEAWAGIKVENISGNNTAAASA